MSIVSCRDAVALFFSFLSDVNKHSYHFLSEHMSEYSRIEIAIESLIQAQKLYGESNFICSVILAGAAQQVIRDLCKSKKIEPVIKTIGKISGRKPKDIHDLIVESYNKSKHADINPNENVFVSADEARVLMTVAATDLMRIDRIQSKRVMDFIEFIRSIKSNDAEGKHD